MKRFKELLQSNPYRLENSLSRGHLLTLGDATALHGVSGAAHVNHPKASAVSYGGVSENGHVEST